MISRNQLICTLPSKHISIFLLLAAITNLFAQAPSQLELNLNKENISWVWQGNLSYSAKTWRQSQLEVDNRFSSNLYRETFQENQWKDENNFKMGWSYPFSQRLKTRTIFDSRIFSDENTETKFNKHIAAQEISFEVHPRVIVKPALGWTVEETFDKQDQGWYTKLGLEINKLDMGGYLNYTDFNSVIRDLPGRKNQEHSFFTGWNKAFSDQASDSLRIGYQFSEKKYYLTPATDVLEQVTINARFVNNQLIYQTGSNSRLSILTEFKNRSIDRVQPAPEGSNRREEVFVSNQFDYRFIIGPLASSSGIMFSQTINDNPGIQTDIDGLQSALTSRLEFRPSERDILSSRFSYTKYEYNTPQEDDDVDDRDEQRFIIDTAYRHRFSPYFELKLKSQIYLYHQIFISPKRSANNNWNRIYQLASGFDYSLGKNIQHRHQLKILANYTVFDFDDILPQIRSYIFRKLVYTDSLSIMLTESLNLNNTYQWESEDNGTFFKNEFSQRVTKEISSHFLNVSLQHQDVLGFRLTTGITFYWRDEWNLVPEERKVREFRSIAPRIIIIYPASKNLLLHGVYAPNRYTNFGENPQYFTTGKLNLQYFF